MQKLGVLLGIILLASMGAAQVYSQQIVTTPYVYSYGTNTLTGYVPLTIIQGPTHTYTWLPGGTTYGEAAADITWTTSKPTQYNYVYYSTSSGVSPTNYQWERHENRQLTSHEVKLLNLQRGGKYYYVVESKMSKEYAYGGSVISKEKSFSIPVLGASSAFVDGYTQSPLKAGFLPSSTPLLVTGLLIELFILLLAVLGFSAAFWIISKIEA